MSTMPIFPVDAMVADWSESDAEIIRACFTGRGVKEGLKLRASKPVKEAKSVRDGLVNYVWRMLCFDLVGWGKHVCMPVCADFDLSYGYDAEFGRVEFKDREGCDRRREVVKGATAGGDVLVKRFETHIPLVAQKGIMRWARAYGVV